MDITGPAISAVRPFLCRFHKKNCFEHQNNMACLRVDVTARSRVARQKARNNGKFLTRIAGWRMFSTTAPRVTRANQKGTNHERI